jgi:hypothetical protein
MQDDFKEEFQKQGVQLDSCEQSSNWTKDNSSRDRGNKLKNA